MGSIDFASDFVRLLLGEGSNGVNSESEAPIQWLLMHADAPQGSCRFLLKFWSLRGSSRFHEFYIHPFTLFSHLWSHMEAKVSYWSFQLSSFSSFPSNPVIFILMPWHILAQSITATIIQAIHKQATSRATVLVKRHDKQSMSFV